MESLYFSLSALIVSGIEFSFSPFAFDVESIFKILIGNLHFFQK